MDPPVEDAYAYRFRVADDALLKSSYGEDHIVFDAEDQVGSYAATSLNKSTPVEVADDGSKIITIRSSVALNAGDQVFAYYPYSSANNKAQATSITMEIPRNQVSGDADAMPMVALPFTLTDVVNKYENTEVGTLEFVNLGSVIKLNIYSSDSKFQGETIENVTFIEEKPVAGSFTYDITSLDVENPAAISGYTETDVVVTGRATVGTSPEDAGVYYMVVAPGKYKGKFIVRTNKADYTYDSSAKEREYSRATVKPLNINLASTNWVANDKYDTSIDSPREFAAFLKGTSADDTAEYTITANLDMTGYTITSASGFGGTLDGGEYEISNLVSNVPLFEENAGTIKNFVLDETCVFTTSERELFAAVVATDKGGTYSSVKNRASVTFAATEDVDYEVVIGGIAALVSGAEFEGCSNSGAVTFDATGLEHIRVSVGGLVGFIDNSSSRSVFTLCTNRGEVSLLAKAGNPYGYFPYGGNWNSAGINVGGIAGSSTYKDRSGDSMTYFNQCINEADGRVHFLHSDMKDVESISDGSPLGIAGILGFGEAKFNKCRNYAQIKAEALVTGEPSESQMKKRNYLLAVAGISGYTWGHVEVESCTNSGHLIVNYSGLFDGHQAHRGCVGGICAMAEYNVKSSINYCKMEGDITVDGRGTMAVGGIIGYNGSQIKNTVTSDCTITVNGRKGDVGGLVGYVAGGANYYTIKACSCAATIFADSDWGSAGKDWYYSIGGLIGNWVGASTGDYPSLTSRSGESCVFDGVISTVYQSRVGAAVGYVSGGTNVFGEESNPIKVSGSFQRKGLEKTIITSDNVETYALGQTKGTTTMYVTSPTVDSKMSVMSFNTAVSQGEWATTKDPILAMLQDLKPDVVGLQEVNDLDVWDKLEAGGKQPWEFLTEGLSGYTGYRPDSKTNAILYNPDVFEVSGQGYFYLGESGSNNSWDNYGSERTVVYMTLMHKRTGNHVFFINTHYPLGQEGQNKSSALIAERLEELNPNDYPVIMVGDFNNTKSSGIFEAFGDTIRDARTYASSYFSDENKSLYTYNGFGDESKARHKVDFMWYSHPVLKADYYEVITQETRPYGDVEYLSDHYPIYSTISFR